MMPKALTGLDAPEEQQPDRHENPHHWLHSTDPYILLTHNQPFFLKNTAS